MSQVGDYFVGCYQEETEVNMTIKRRSMPHFCPACGFPTSPYHHAVLFPSEIEWHEKNEEMSAADVIAREQAETDDAEVE